MTQLITRLSWNDPWSSTHHLAAKCTYTISPFVFLLLLEVSIAADYFYAWYNILRLLNEDKQGIWHSIVPKMRTTNEHIGAGGLWPEMYGTSESHISPVVLYTIRKTLFCLKRAELFLLYNFSLFFGWWERDFFMWWCWWNFVLCDLLHFEWRMITSC